MAFFVDYSNELRYVMPYWSGVFDHHQHVGWYTDGYHSPKEIWENAVRSGVSDIAVSSTSVCAEKYKLVVKEMKTLKRLGGAHVHPFLWLSPRMMRTYGLRLMLRSCITWEGVKMHWQAHKEWFYNRSLQRKAIDVARELDVPVLLHTGNFKECEAGVFLHLCQENSDVPFILAHGRPLEQTMNVMRLCPNTFADTAFMPVEDMAKLVDNGFENRILFGTDTPIDRLYKIEDSSKDYIRGCIKEIQMQFPMQVTQKIFNSNQPI